MVSACSAFTYPSVPIHTMFLGETTSISEMRRALVPVAVLSKQGSYVGKVQVPVDVYVPHPHVGIQFRSRPGEAEAGWVAHEVVASQADGEPAPLHHLVHSPRHSLDGLSMSVGYEL